MLTGGDLYEQALDTLWRKTIMQHSRWISTLAIAGIIGAIVMNILSQRIRGFPQEAMLVFWPAEYVWGELKTEVGKGLLRTIVSNVAIFGLLGGVEGAIIGILIDLYTNFRQAALKRRVEYLPYSKDPINPAFRRRVLEVLVKYDPANLIESGSDEESYRPEAEIILTKLKNLGSAKNLQKFCQRQFRRHFGRDAVRTFDKYESLADNIWSDYEQLKASPRRPPPTSEGL